MLSDGLPLVWQLHRHGFAQAEQVRGPDLTVRLCEEAAAAGLPVYFYGGDGTLMTELRAELGREIPTLEVAGAEAAPMLPRQPGTDQALVERIRASGARLVLVGLGCPKQEFWMQAHRPHLDAVLVGRRPGVRDHRRARARGPGLDAPRRPGMAVPGDLRAAPAVAPLPGHQHAVRGLPAARGALRPLTGQRGAARTRRNRPLTTSSNAAASASPTGSPSSQAELITPTAGTASTLIAATWAGSRVTSLK